jgi:methyltransferase (TIGR00027 family)
MDRIMSFGAQYAGVAPGSPSRTSIAVAAGRALGAREKDPSVRNPDWLAERLLGPAELELIKDHPAGAALAGAELDPQKQMEATGMTMLMLIRTRFIDEHLERALNEGAAQVVILGAGFDTRAYRFEDQLGGRKVFELDFHSTQEFKKRRVQEALGGIPSNVTFVEVDFKTENLEDVLIKAGYQRGEKACFIWEGVSMYLAESAARGMLRAIHAIATPGSRLIMDFAEQAWIDVATRFPNHPFNRYTRRWGEPWIFGVPDGREREFFSESGFEMREIMSLYGKEPMRRYATRADGTRVSAGYRGNLRLRIAGTIRFLPVVLRMIGMMLIRRTRWYAIAELVVA